MCAPYGHRICMFVVTHSTNKYYINMLINKYK